MKSTFRRFVVLVLAAIAFFTSAHAQREKTVIAVLTLRNTAGVSAGETELLSDRMRIELFNTGGFTVMERDQMQEILKEQGFQQSGACTDEGCMIEIGQLLGVKQLVAGSIGKLGSMFLVNIRSIDIGTGKISKVVAEDVRGGIEDVVERLPVIAKKLAGEPHESASVPPPPRPRQEQARPVETSPPPSPAPSPTPAKTGTKLKEAKIYFEAASFSATTVALDMTPDEWQKLNKEVTRYLLDALNEVFDDDVSLATTAQISTQPDKNAVVIRIRLDNYSTQPAKMGQNEGTAQVSLGIFEGFGAPTPSFTVQYTEKGNRHWGAYVPFVNAFESIAETIEKTLDKNDWVRELPRRL